MITRITKSILIFSLILISLYSCSQKQNKNNSESSIKIEKKIDSILSLLTLKEKIDMCHAQSKFSTKGVGRLGIPEIWMSDGPHGVRAEISWDSWDHAGWTNDSITAFPALTCLAASFNPQLSGDYGFSIGEEARYRKKDVLLGPGVNIYRTPLNGRNFEYMGEDPYLASTIVVPYIKGVQKNGVAACVKHFALNNQEHWRSSVNVEVSDRALHEIYLPAFKASVEEAKVWSIMGAYNKFRGQHTTHHKLLTNKILKGDWKFDGVVISDWSSVHSTKEAALYGLDLEMGTGTDGLGTTTLNHYDQYFLANPFYKAIKNGELSEDLVNDKVRRILRLMYRTSLNKDKPTGKINSKDHHSTARKVATEGIVLLKNENNFFPIKDTKEITIAVIGENATRPMTPGGGSSELKPQFEISPLEGLKKRYKNAKIIHSMGYQTGPSFYDVVLPATLNQDSLRIAALETAKKADIILYVGGLNKSHLQDCEGDDRQSYRLPYNQEQLILELKKINPNLGMLLITGNAVDTSWLPNVKGLLQTWYLGSMAGTAIADVVSGDANPSGKLPFSFPKNLTDNAAHSFGETSYPGVNYIQEYKEDILVGYRWHDTKNIEATFPFGFGLSYTNFQLSDIQADRNEYSKNEVIQITSKVTNSGDVYGAEVFQVYIGKENSKVKRAVKELKGFQKVYLKKGEEKKVSIKIDVKKLAFYNEEISDWEIEKGDYIIYVGNSSKHISKKFKISIH